MNAMPPQLDTPADDLRAWVAELSDINHGLLRLVAEQRRVYTDLIERTLLILAAHGYKPAASALLTIREMMDNAQAQADEHMREVRRARGDA